jgi:uncharacterized protein YcbK (DUF882 family)
VHRRQIIRAGLAAAGASLFAGPAPALAAALSGASSRKLSLVNLHTGEHLAGTYWENGAYVPQALAAMNHVLRDHRTGEVRAIEPTVFDLMTALSKKAESARPFEIICGYRSPATNAMLHDTTTGVASKSLHMQGQAVDLRLPGVQLAHLRDAALDLKLGGVGYYPASDFVHVDVGRVRRW